MELVVDHQDNRRANADKDLPDDSVKGEILEVHSGEGAEVTTAAHPDTGGLSKTSCRAAAQLAAASILLLLAGVTILLLCSSSSGCKEEARLQLQTSCSDLQMSFTNLTVERDHLEKHYSNMSKERAQLQASYNSLRAEQRQLESNWTQQRDQLLLEKGRLQRQVQAMAKEKTDLQAKLEASEASLRNLKQERTRMNTLLDNFGWVYFRGSFYYVSSTEATWQNSRNDCQQKGCDLLVINSREEQVFANQFQKYLWIGLTDLEREGTWKWVDGTPANTWYWGPAEPNGATAENCGQIKFFNNEDSWNDEGCSHLMYWICEKKLILN